ncbi:ribosome-associated translation inhibitor RaiA [Aliiglaciecola sp.]|nr:ribosome-associated translation inhibitor RaiA [Aliiglaciecola sp.]|mmetsp:Transcript_7102/g.9372  ORF Transcript_7102/g.9372 Transcript_7102/m.9372 type:complete len:119 (+) Transcript_7102:166-522(+)|eukprot:CAMPEP_0184466226 /NCGR_PEP_ID=MMETSP0740-20130409/65089_1 /TAXON_ID=385413 /ORGANISM="Thalassiosira miniscula, Strain CCMP1093" /LENGTH=118 /DNA_ID=CAMNT_0026841243 /DNA_START=166 /DNA_END=522 /DNA_ORIENTATION=-
MKINASGHNIEINGTIREDLETKFEKISNRYSSLISLDITITKEHGEYDVELRTNYEGAAVASSGKDKVMYPAINKAAKKLEVGLAHRKGILKDNLHQKPEVTAPEIAYEKIQEMKIT